MVSLGDGLTIVRVAHRGSGHFAASVLDEEGRALYDVAAGDRPYGGSRALSLGDPGDCKLAVEAIGAWAIRIEQPTPTGGRPLPTTFAGQGDQATDFFQADHGLVRFCATHRGPGTFRVALLDAQGEEIDRLALAEGDYDGSRTTELDRGVYLVQVEVVGRWTIDVSGQ